MLLNPLIWLEEIYKIKDSIFHRTSQPKGGSLFSGLEIVLKVLRDKFQARNTGLKYAHFMWEVGNGRHIL